MIKLGRLPGGEPPPDADNETTKKAAQAQLLQVDGTLRATNDPPEKIKERSIDETESCHQWIWPHWPVGISQTGRASWFGIGGDQ
jgi:hypothetical protein